MKKFFTISAIIIVFFAIVGVGFLFLLPKKTDEFTLYKEKGVVYYKESGSEYKKLEQDTIKLKEGSFVKTEDGYAHVLFSDNSMVSIDKNSEIEFAKIQKNEKDLTQIVGNTYHRIQKLIGNKTYRVKSLTTIAAIRGTKFNLNVQNKNNSSAFVNEGTVLFTLLDNNSNETNKIIELKAGQFIDLPVFTENEKYQAVQIPAYISSSIWFKRNLIIDKLFDESKSFEFIQNLSKNNDLLRLEETESEEKDLLIDEGKEVIQEFFELINSGENSDAAMMLSKNLVGDEPAQANSALQQWAVVFNSWQKVQLVNVIFEKKFENKIVYKVEFNITFKPNAEKYLYEEGSNTRWFQLAKVNEKWEIDNISTSM